MQVFLDVIVDVSHTEVDRIFEYSYPDDNIVEGCRVLVPFGKYEIEGFVLSKKQKSEYSPEKIKPIIKILDKVPSLTHETLSLSKFVKERYHVTYAQALRLFLPAEMRKGRVKEKTAKFVKILGGAKIENKKCTPKQLSAFDYLTENGETSLAELSKLFGAGVINGLKNKELVLVFDKEILRSPYALEKGDNKSVRLTENQENAVSSIENTDKTVSLIYGVTGSGKTEIYLKLIEKIIRENKTAIMLVPEISLTPQMLKKLRGRFGAIAAILHSGLSSGERYDEWMRLRNGEAKIAIGARSAIFAPLTSVGLIVIDEEHDGSYESESAPRYSTIEIAKERAKISNAKIVLGSATPKIESFLKAQNGEYNLVTLKERINKRALPDIEVVDMKREIKRGNNTPFSSALKSELELCLNSGNQAIIFLNQRGFSRSVICAECGHVQKCQSCDVSLTYHREDDSLLCHYCGAKYKMIEACTECGSTYLRYGGFGTEKVVLELQKLFPNAKILRMDRDSTQNKEGHFKILKEFAEKKADILVGTQMIAKGHDFPSVTLVGILDADMSLHFSDYRSSERTFELITQVAGRSGRAEEVGKVVLQTYSPEHPVLGRAIKYDYEGYYNHEISIRKATGFPPFTDIIRILVSSKDDEKALSTIKELYGEFSAYHKLNLEKFKFLGCMKSPLKKLQDKFRYQVLMRVERDDNETRKEVFRLSDKYTNKNVMVYVEINPNNLS